MDIGSRHDETPPKFGFRLSAATPDVKEELRLLKLEVAKKDATIESLNEHDMRRGMSWEYVFEARTPERH
jgi:hypothetical protein